MWTVSEECMKNKIRNLTSANETKLALLQQKYELKCKEVDDVKESNKYFADIHSLAQQQDEVG